MPIGVSIEETANHSLIWHLGTCGVRLEKFHASLAKRDGDLNTILLQDKLIWRRQKIIHHLKPTERLICVLWRVLHRVSCLCASNRRQ